MVKKNTLTTTGGNPIGGNETYFYPFNPNHIDNHLFKFQLPHTLMNRDYRFERHH